ncbi:MAG: GntR family transcriptional regulator, partial [Kiritimatiellae bacterium]|nr:GntR family transcriptional regulator [Kiritimatiellia bacterium]
VLAGEYALGKLPSERALIRQYGISRATAAKVLATLESEGLVVRRRGAGAFVNPQSATPENAYVSTLIADMDVREFFSAVCGSIADRARAYNLNLLWGARREFEDLARNAPLPDYIRRCRAFGVRGVFFVPQDSPGDAGRRNREIAETLRDAGIAVVLIDRDIVPFPQRSDFDFVGIDNVQAGYRQATHLLSQGCRRLVYVSHAKQVWTVDARFSGFRNALEERGLPAETGAFFCGDPSDDAFVRAVMRARPDGVVFVHDDMAIAFMCAWARLSRRKVRYIGLDDISHCRHLGISSMRQPARFIGEEAARLMAMRLGHDAMPPRQVLFSAELAPRRSSLGE